jgi:hypothetical protein
LTTIPQHTWVNKLFEYDFVVEYQQGKFNVVTDALSRQHEDSMGIHAISGPSLEVFDALRAELQDSPEALQRRAKLAVGTAPPG